MNGIETARNLNVFHIAGIICNYQRLLTLSISFQLMQNSVLAELEN